MASTQINLRQPVVLDLADFDAVFDIAQRGRAHDFPPSMPAPIIRRCAGTLAQRCCRDCDPDHLFLPLAGNRSCPASAWANYYATSLTSWKWLPLAQCLKIALAAPPFTASSSSSVSLRISLIPDVLVLVFVLPRSVGRI